MKTKKVCILHPQSLICFAMPTAVASVLGNMLGGFVSTTIAEIRLIDGIS